MRVERLAERAITALAQSCPLTELVLELSRVSCGAFVARSSSAMLDDESAQICEKLQTRLAFYARRERAGRQSNLSSDEIVAATSFRSPLS